MNFRNSYDDDSAINIVRGFYYVLLLEGRFIVSNSIHVSAAS